jgi:phospho-N-acetylmuramoyl-pentapeptide-transferase
MLYKIFYEILYNPEGPLSFFRLFGYVTFRSAGAIALSIILSLILGPLVIKLLTRKKASQQIRDDGPQTHQSKSGTPTMGGVIIIGVTMISTLLFARINNPYIITAMMGTFGFAIIGFIDDYFKLTKKNTAGLSSKTRIIGEIAIALVITTFLYIQKQELAISLVEGESTIPLEWSIFGDLNVPFLNEPVLQSMGWLYIPFGVVVIVGCANGVNFTDGLDGLAIGLVCLVTGTLAVLSYLTGNAIISDYLNIPFVNGSAELTIFLVSIVGAGLGFLWFNSHPASIFMGDTGALPLGAAIGIVALLIKKELLLLIIGAIFVVEVLSVIIQVLFYKWKKIRVFKMAPLHHHFELSGWSESKVINRFWIIGIILSIIGLATLKIQ